MTRLAADALRGDGTALGKTRRGLFRIGLSRSSKHRYTPDGAPAARAGSFVARARRALPSQNALLESIAVRLPESTLIRFELFFLRAHNVRSLKFDFPEYVMECIDWDSCDTLGMSPGRWCIATVIILVMGPFENINLIVSVVSVCVILGLAAWLKTRVDLVLRAEKRGDGVTDAQLFLLGRPASRGALHRHPVPAGVPRRHLDLRRLADRRRGRVRVLLWTNLVRARLRGHRARLAARRGIRHPAPRRASRADVGALPLGAPGRARHRRRQAARRQPGSPAQGHAALRYGGAGGAAHPASVPGAEETQPWARRQAGAVARRRLDDGGPRAPGAPRCAWRGATCDQGFSSSFLSAWGVDDSW